MARANEAAARADMRDEDTAHTHRRHETTAHTHRRHETTARTDRRDEDGARIEAAARTDRRPGRMWRRRAAIAILAAALAATGCARPGIPGGGPEDSTPPTVAGTIPEAGETGVDRRSQIRIEFSEEMNRQSAERAFAITPELELGNFRWQGRSLVTDPAEDLPDSTTFVVQIGLGAKDYHGVKIAAAHAFAFSTGTSVDDGTIGGLVTSLGEPAPGAVVWACLGAVEPDTLGLVMPCGYATSSGDDGAFVIEHVKISDSPYSLVGFLDDDADGRFAPAIETGWVVVNAAFVTDPGDSVGGLEIPLYEPAGGAGDQEE